MIKFFKFLKEDISNVKTQKDIEKQLKKILNKIDIDQPLTEDEQKFLIDYYQIYAKNRKTQIAIDFMAGSQAFSEWGTCAGTCQYCYVLKSFKQGQKGWQNKLIRLTKLIKFYPEVYKKALEKSLNDYFQKENIEAIRWFGSGDYQPFMKDVIITMAQTFPKKKWYIISKTLTLDSNYNDLLDLLQYKNIYVNLSFHKPTIDKMQKYEPLKKMYPNLRIAYTLDQYEGVKIWKAKYDPETKQFVKGEEIDVDDLEVKAKEEYLKSKEKRELKRQEFERQINVVWSNIINTLPSEYRKNVKLNVEGSYPDNIRLDLDVSILDKKYDVIDKLLTYLKSIDSMYVLNKNKTDKYPDRIFFSPPSKPREKREKEKPFTVDIFDPEVVRKLKIVVEISPEYFEKLKIADVIFNVNKKTAYRLGYYGSKLVFCQCDLKLISEYRACVTSCKTCFSANLAHSKIEESVNNKKVISFIMTEVDLNSLKDCCG